MKDLNILNIRITGWKNKTLQIPSGNSKFIV